jgi:hypothetical protein
MGNHTGVLHFLLYRSAGPNAPTEVPAGLAQIVRRLLRKNSFFEERSGNVYENKGSLWKTGERSGNMHQNKGT